MKKILLLLLLPIASVAQSNLYFPANGSSVWDTAHPANLGWCQEGIDTLVQFAGNKNTKALIILKDGKMALEKYYGTFTADSLWYWASAGKTLTATMVGIAQQEGYLTIQDPSANYLGSGWGTMTLAQEQAIKVYHHLSMSTGLDPDVDDIDCTLDTCLVYETFPGIDWYYHNAAYSLLQWMVDSATGINYQLYFANKLRNPLGMNGFWFNQGYNSIYASNARSAARFGLMILAEGRWHADTILKDTAYFHTMVNTSQTMNESYGYLWWLNGKNSFMLPGSKLTFNGQLFPDAPTDMIAALGKNDQKIYVVPSQNMVVVRMGNDAGVSLAGPSSFDNELWQRINGLVCTTGMDLEATPTVTLYPNPARHSFKLEGINGHVAILNLQGQVVKSWAEAQDEYPLDDLPRGAYIVRVSNGKQMVQKQLIIAP